MAFYASCSPEQLSFEIREFYKDSFDKICNELLVDIRSEIDQIYESYNLGVSGRIASARKRRVEQIYFYIQFAFFWNWLPKRKAELIESLPLSSFYYSGKSFQRLFNGKDNEDKLAELKKRQSAILKNFDLSHTILFQRLISSRFCHK